MKIQHNPLMRLTATMPPAELRRCFVLEGLFKTNQVVLNYWETDRTVVGGATPAGRTLTLHVPAELRAKHFNDRRELGVINLGGPGRVTVDGQRFAMEHLDSLYVGRGTKRVSFASRSAKTPARFYLLSYPAHVAYPTQIKRADLAPRVLGSDDQENHRILHQVIHPGRFPTCQLVMGFTLVQPGSKWNTMPPHTHLRRSEVYCYFGFPARRRSVKHFLGEPSGVQHHPPEARARPCCRRPWSVHSGEGSSHYGFVWGMGGENQDWADMDPVDPKLIHRGPLTHLST